MVLARLRHRAGAGAAPGPAPAGDGPAAPRAAGAAARAAAAAAARQRAADPHVQQAVRSLTARAKEDTQRQVLGTLVFGCLMFAAGAMPASLPWAFVVFALVVLPLRVVAFVRQKWTFFLLDFCYLVNVTTLLYLLLAPDSPALGTLVRALADGPIAGALVAWQCPWVMGSNEHTTSVLMHLLPGLAVYANLYHTPPGLRGWHGLAGCVRELLRGRVPALGDVPLPPPRPDDVLLWLVAAPLAFYMAWQLAYFLVVQVLCRQFILAHHYETSYTCLARRAAKTQNVWHRLVRRGSPLRRCCVYGALQLAYTVICICVFAPTYYCQWLAVAFQAVKLFFPILYGSRYTAHKVPAHTFLQGLAHLEQHRSAAQAAAQLREPQQGRQAAAAPGPAAPAAQRAAAQPRHSCAAEAAPHQGLRGPAVPRAVLA